MWMFASLTLIDKHGHKIYRDLADLENLVPYAKLL